MFIHPPAAVAGKTKYNALSRGAKIIMKYENIKDALSELKVFTPEQVQESLFKKGDIVTIKKDTQYELVDTDEDGKNQAASVKITIKRGEEELERTITLRTLFGTIRTDVTEGMEEGVDMILQYAKATYESRFICPFNVAESIKLGRTTDDWQFTIVERKALVAQYVDRKSTDIHDSLKKKTFNGQKHVNGLYRLKKVTISERP